MDNRSLPKKGKRKKEKKKKRGQGHMKVEEGGTGGACSDKGTGRKRKETHNYLIRHLAS